METLEARIIKTVLSRANLKVGEGEIVPTRLFSLKNGDIKIFYDFRGIPEGAGYRNARNILRSSSIQYKYKDATIIHYPVRLNKVPEEFWHVADYGVVYEKEEIIFD